MSEKILFDGYEERSVETKSVLFLMDKKENKEYPLKEIGSDGTKSRITSTIDDKHTLQIIQGNFIFERRDKFKIEDNVEKYLLLMNQLRLIINKKNINGTLPPNFEIL